MPAAPGHDDFMNPLVPAEDPDDHVVELLRRSKQEHAVECAARELYRVAQTSAPPSGIHRRGLILIENEEATRDLVRKWFPALLSKAWHPEKPKNQRQTVNHFWLPNQTWDGDQLH